VTSCTALFITHCRTLTGAALTLRAWVGFFISGPMLRRNHTGPVKTILSTTESIYRQLSPFFSCSHYKTTVVRFVYDCNQTEGNRKEDFESASKQASNIYILFTYSMVQSPS
jgi:hypothetical protein